MSVHLDAFVIGGQSNAVGFGNDLARIPAVTGFATYYDQGAISAVNGHPWPSTGDAWGSMPGHSSSEPQGRGGESPELEI